MTHSGLRLHQLWFHNRHKEPFSHCFCHYCCCWLEKKNKSEFCLLLQLLWKESLLLWQYIKKSTKRSVPALVKDLLSLLDKLVTVIKPWEKGNKSSFPCEDRSILLQVIHIQTERDKQVRVKRRCHSSKTELNGSCYFKDSRNENKFKLHNKLELA